MAGFLESFYNVRLLREALNILKKIEEGQESERMWQQSEEDTRDLQHADDPVHKDLLLRPLAEKLKCKRNPWHRMAKHILVLYETLAWAVGWHRIVTQILDLHKEQHNISFSAYLHLARLHPRGVAAPHEAASAWRGVAAPHEAASAWRGVGWAWSGDWSWEYSPAGCWSSRAWSA